MKFPWTIIKKDELEKLQENSIKLASYMEDRSRLLKSIDDLVSENRKRYGWAGLHQSLDVLSAAYISEAGGMPSKNTILELMQWSHEKTKSTDVVDG